MYNTPVELANSVMVRRSTPADAAPLRRLLEQASFVHIHADWHYPADWLGTEALLLAEQNSRLVACLAVAADPPPAAWVQLAALRESSLAPAVWPQLLNPLLPGLQATGVNEVAWLPAVALPAEWTAAMNFRTGTHIQTYDKPNLELPSEPPNPAVHLRPVRADDLPALVAVEEAAFDPLWRHSLDGLSRGWMNALTFDVAEVDGQVVGFQYSSRSQVSGRAHLVRITVHPQAQRQGVGSALLAHALEGYRRYRLRGVSLNTQVDNFPSQRLYARFGFRPVGDPLPVWVRGMSG